MSGTRSTLLKYEYSSEAMFLRSLYGSRTPRTLNPPVDQQASSYWEEDTVSSQEIARVMEEENDIQCDHKEKEDSVLMSALVGGRDVVPALLSQMLRSENLALQDINGFRMEDIISSRSKAQLSPDGLISIAAADVDEAVHDVPPITREPDPILIHSFAPAFRNDSGPSLEARTFSNGFNRGFIRLLESLPASTNRALDDSPADGEEMESENKLFALVGLHFKMLRSTPALFSTSTNNKRENYSAEQRTKLRFLSLLRRINELYSEPVDRTGVWDGVPYPQIVALPTFKYHARECLQDTSHADADNRVSNTTCVVCSYEFEVEQEVRALPCLHFYHRECIDQWLMWHSQCPTCKHFIITN